MIRSHQGSFPYLIPLLSGLIWLSSLSSAYSQAAPFKIDFSDQDGVLNFTVSGVQEEQLDVSLNDERQSLLKITVSGVKVSKKYWIKSFKACESDPDLKGIMVRNHEGNVEIRVRFRRKIPQSGSSLIQPAGNGSQVTLISVPRSLGKGLTAPETEDAPEEKEAEPKPTLDPKLQRIGALSSSLSEEKEAEPKPAPSQSVFDRGTPVAPLPKYEPVRPVASVASPPISKPELSVATVNPSSPSGSSTPEVLGDQADSPLPPAQPAQDHSSVHSSSDRNPTHRDLTGSKPKDQVTELSVGQNTPGKSESFDWQKLLDQLSEVVAYLLAFILLLWLASYLYKRGRESNSSDLGHSIKILSQKVVNLNPRQRLIVIETMGHTIVVGACDRGGLSPIAHLSTPNGPIGSASPNVMSSMQDLSGFDHLQSGGRESYNEYYRESDYDLRDEDDYLHTPRDAGHRVDFEESTFVGEDSYTVEVPSVSELRNDHHPRDVMASADSYNGNQYSVGSAQSHLDDMRYEAASRVSESDGESAGFSIDSDEDDANMKPENLLQLIQKLNGSKG